MVKQPHRAIFPNPNCVDCGAPIVNQECSRMTRENKKDLLNEDIEYAMGSMLENIMNTYDPDELRRAPKLMKKYFKETVKALEIQLADWDDECEHEGGNFNQGPNGSMVCVDCNQKV